MGGCQSFLGSGDEASHTLTVDNHGDINALKLKNNNVQKSPSVQEKASVQDHYLRERISDVNLLRCPHCHMVWIGKSGWPLILSHSLKILISSQVLCQNSALQPAAQRQKGQETMYEWTDENGRKLKCSAPLYTDYAMSYIHELLTDENVFPTGAGVQFPNGFMFLVQKVFLLLFRTLSHLFSAHYRDAVALDIHPHLNTLLAHFITFSHTFRLLEASETAPLDELINTLTQ